MFKVRVRRHRLDVVDGDDERLWLDLTTTPSVHAFEVESFTDESLRLSIPLSIADDALPHCTTVRQHLDTIPRSSNILKLEMTMGYV